MNETDRKEMAHVFVQTTCLHCCLVVKGWTDGDEWRDHAGYPYCPGGAPRHVGDLDPPHEVTRLMTEVERQEIESAVQQLAEVGTFVSHLQGGEELRAGIRKAARSRGIKVRTGVNPRQRVYAHTADCLPAEEPHRSGMLLCLAGDPAAERLRKAGVDTTPALPDAVPYDGLPIVAIAARAGVTPAWLMENYPMRLPDE